MSDNFDEESNAGAPVSSFQTYAAEGDLYAKQGDVRKAIEAYSKVQIAFLAFIFYLSIFV